MLDLHYAMRRLQALGYTVTVVADEPIPWCEECERARPCCGSCCGNREHYDEWFNHAAPWSNFPSDVGGDG